MTRYIFCILLGAFLMLGISSTLNKDMEESRIETGTAANIQPSAERVLSESEAIIQQSYKGNSAVNYEGYNCKTNNGILGSSILFRTIPPSKILKSNPTTLAIQTLSSLDSLLPEKNWTNLSFYTNLTRDSYRYYIYTLNRILI